MAHCANYLNKPSVLILIFMRYSFDCDRKTVLPVTFLVLVFLIYKYIGYFVEIIVPSPTQYGQQAKNSAAKRATQVRIWNRMIVQPDLSVLYKELNA